MNRDLPGPQGLYDPAFEHDACGVAFVADMHGRKSHTIVKRGIEALCNLEHRGAAGAEVNTPATAPGSFSRCPTGSFAAPSAFSRRGHARLTQRHHKNT